MKANFDSVDTILSKADKSGAVQVFAVRHSSNRNVIPFHTPARATVSELDRGKFYLALNSYVSQGYEIEVLNSSYRKTRFGGSTTYYAELARA